MEQHQQARLGMTPDRPGETAGALTTGTWEAGPCTVTAVRGLGAHLRVMGDAEVDAESATVTAGGRSTVRMSGAEAVTVAEDRSTVHVMVESRVYVDEGALLVYPPAWAARPGPGPWGATGLVYATGGAIVYLLAPCTVQASGHHNKGEQ
ncbi:MAG: hypothetical protein ACRD0D_03715 [Acidimicrobiales bacterium]